MKVVETSIVGAEVLQSRTQAIILGISINNSYFKEENLEKLLCWATGTVRWVYAMIPDEPMVSTFIAMGYSEKDATRKARLKANALETKCRKIISTHRFHVEIIRWRDVVVRGEYTRALNAITALYDLDIPFQSAIFRATESVLRSNDITDPSEHQIDVGVNFLLKELAFISYSDQILVKEKVAYIYNKTTETLKDIIEGKYMFRASSNVGFATIC